MKRTIRTKTSQDSAYADNTTMMQRICIALLALVLCIGLMPSFAWAAGEEDAVDGEEQNAVVEEQDGDDAEEEAINIALFAADDEADESGDEVDAANTPMVLAEGEDEETSDEEATDETGESADEGEEASSTSYDTEKAKELLDNLTKRFSKGGEDAAISNDTVYAALGLNMLEKGDQIDADAILENLNSFEETNGYAPTAGVLAKYIMALTAAGQDCTHVLNDSGGTHDLISEMDALISVDDMDIYSAVWILAAYHYGSYEQSSSCEMSVEAIADFILGSANDDGLFGSEEYGYDTQTTAQAAYALILHYDAAIAASVEYLEEGDEDAYQSALDYAGNVLAAIIAAEAGMQSLQNSDGGIGYSSEYPESSIDATANAAVVFQAMGMDPTDASLFIHSDVPIMEYLVDEADEDLNGYTESGTYDEAMTSSTVLMALAAVDSGLDFAEGLTANNSTDSTSSNPASYSSGTGSGSGTGSTGSTGNTGSTSASPSTGSTDGSSLAKTGDDNMTVAATTGIVALCALVVALIAARRLRRLSTN